MTTTRPAVIQTQGLSKIYGEVQALNDLNLEVPKNSITGFLGPNGAGKSTTIKLLLGLIRPTAGTGQVFGLDIEQESKNIRRRVGHLAQHPTFYPELTARETLRFVAHFFLSDTREVEERVDASLALVGLEEKADRPVRGFSGGETQRLGIAQAQINEPDLLILDEPAAALDPMGRAQVLDIMDRLRERTTIFYSTHILDDVQRVSDRVVILNQGQLVSQGPIDDLLLGETGLVYRLSLCGNVDSAYRRLKAQPWISKITSTRHNGCVDWHVAVSDEQAARHQLLRLVLADEKTDVVSFDRAEYELEEVFMRLVKETAHG